MNILQKEDLIKKSEKELLNMLPSWFQFKLKPFKHQLVSLVYANQFDSVGLFLEMGTGKTKVCIDYLRLKKCKKILVIGVNAILYNWKEEFKLNAGNEYKVTVLDGSQEEKNKILKEDKYDVYIVNYEGLYWRNNKLNKKEKLNIHWKQSVDSIIATVEDRILDGLKKQWDAIVVDESRAIANIESIRSRVVLYLSRLAKYRIIMTGTPVIKMLTEIMPQYYVIDYGLTFGDKPKALLYKLYNVDYQRLGWTGRYIPVVIPKQGAEQWVKNRMFSRAIRFEKSECIDLPEKIYENRFVTLEGDQKVAYEKMKKENKLSIIIKKRDIKELRAVLIRFMQVCGGFLKIGENEYKSFKNNAKLTELMDLLTGELADKKVVISAVFKAEQKAIYEAIKKAGIGVVKITGNMTPDEIKKSEKEFLYNDKIKCIVLSPKVGARGINLAVADYVVLYSMSFDFEEQIQLEDRVHRLPPQDLQNKLKNKKKVTYIRLLAKDTVDDKVILILNRDRKTVQELLEQISDISTN